MNLISQLRSLLTRLKMKSPSGFATAFQIQYATPKYFFHTYDSAWMDYYSKEGLVTKDPSVRWGFANNGIASSEELEDLDGSNVFLKAADFGLKYWTITATSERGLKSIGAFSRSDRDFSAVEREDIFGVFSELHHLTFKGPEAEPEFGEMLLELSIRQSPPKI